MTLPTYPLQPRSQHALWDTLAPSVTREWQFDKRVILFHLQSTQTHSVDCYYEAVKQTMANWSPNALFLCLYDYSGLSVSAAPYVRQRMRDLMALSPTLEGYGAVVVSALYDCWAKTLCQTGVTDSRRYALFRTCDEGISWLAQKLTVLPRRQSERGSANQLYQRLL